MERAAALYVPALEVFVQSCATEHASAGGHVTAAAAAAAAAADTVVRTFIDDMNNRAIVAQLWEEPVLPRVAWARRLQMQMLQMPPLPLLPLLPPLLYLIMRACEHSLLLQALLLARASSSSAEHR